MNRIDRISGILIQLQSRPIVKAQQIAERFGVSVRTIYRDIRTLSEAGVPICGDAGVGYSLMEGYRLPPLMFTKEEALAFITAEKFMQHFTDEGNSKHFCEGMDKIRAVLRMADKTDLETVEQSIEIYKNRKLPIPQFPNLLQTILKSIHQKRSLQMSYFTPSRHETTERMIDAVGVSYIYPYWYLSAYCHWRNEYRYFRLDRIEALKTTDNLFSRNHPSLKALLADIDDPSCLTEVVLQTTAETVLKMGDRKYHAGLVSEIKSDNHTIQQVYMTYSLDIMTEWVLPFYDTVTVVKPEILNKKLQEKIQLIFKKVKL